MGEQEPEKHLFMLCRQLKTSALCPPPEGIYFRPCQRSELDLWMAMPFDTPEEATEYRGFMQSFFDRVYAPQADLFFERCTFACDDKGPLATAFTWKTILGINTFHWLKVLKGREGGGIGRAILSYVMKTQLSEADYPILLHTHPTSYRAVKLYSDIGFELLSDPIVGSRENHLEESLPFLKSVMPPRAFESLVITRAPSELLERLRDEIDPEF